MILALIAYAFCASAAMTWIIAGMDRVLDVPYIIAATVQIILAPFIMPFLVLFGLVAMALRTARRLRGRTTTTPLKKP